MQRSVWRSWVTFCGGLSRTPRWLMRMETLLRKKNNMDTWQFIDAVWQFIFVPVIMLAVYFLILAFSRYPKTKWRKVKENDEYTMYEDEANTNDKNSTHANGWKFVNKKEYLEKRNRQ